MENQNVTSNSGLAVVKVDRFNGTTKPDKNGKMPVILIASAGKIPNRNVLSGTVAEMQGFEVDKAYLVQFRKRGTDKAFGEDYTFTKLQEITTVKDHMDALNTLGNGDVFQAYRPEGFENKYHRKGDKVESLQTRRAREGQYEFVIPRDNSGKTAAELIPGSTITGATDDQLNLKGEDLVDRHKKPEKKGDELN